MLIHGDCHCGKLSYELDSRRAEEDIRPRACQCSFCHAHSAKTWSDPAGKAMIRVHAPGDLSRYRFALGVTEFFICRGCGAYLGAVISNQNRLWSTLNLRLSPLGKLPAVVADYAAESLAERISRRQVMWTPTRLARAGRQGGPEKQICI